RHPRRRARHGVPAAARRPRRLPRPRPRHRHRHGGRGALRSRRHRRLSRNRRVRGQIFVNDVDVNAPILDVSGLSVAYDGVHALEEVSLLVWPDEAVGLFGANGAGKSSLLRAIIGLTPITSGAISYVGKPIAALPAERRALLGIGYSPEGRRVFPGMTVRENLEVACRDEAETRDRRAASIFAL